MISKKSLCVLGLLMSVLVCGCIYSTSFDAGIEQYVVLYGYEEWASDTGWSKEQLANATISVWDNVESPSRTELGTVPIGSRMRVLSSSKTGYQVVHPETKIVGWIAKMYVKEIAPVRIPTAPVEVSTVVPPVLKKMSAPPVQKTTVVAAPVPRAQPVAKTPQPTGVATQPAVRVSRELMVSPVAQTTAQPRKPRREVSVVKVS